MADDSGQPLHMQWRSGYISDLSGQKARQAEEAKQAAVQIVQDALQKGFYGFPVSFYYTCSDPVDSYKFCCIPTEKFLRDLLEKLQRVVFKEDENPDESETFAYVCPEEDASTVYLCEEFWDAPDHLCRDSKPGTLIHEVSHLLGTDDVTYELVTVELWEDYGTLLGQSGSVRGVDGEWHCREEVAQINANTLEHEYETVLNHEGSIAMANTCAVARPRDTLSADTDRPGTTIYIGISEQKREIETKLSKNKLAKASGEGPSEAGRKYAKLRNQACRKSYGEQRTASLHWDVGEQAYTELKECLKIREPKQKKKTAMKNAD